MNRKTFESEIGESYVKVAHPSGLEIFILEKPQYTSAYAMFGTKYGSIDTRFRVGETKIDVPEGIAHFLEHKLFESEEGDAFTRYAETGGSANAYTSFDRTCYLFSCSGRFYENLAILLDFVQSPYFTAETVKKEQGIIGQEIRMYEDSPGWRVTFNMLRAMYKNHPVRIDIAGTVDSIAKIDDKLLYQCYETFYNLSNMFICVAGNVDTEKVISQIGGALKTCEPVEIERGTFDEPDDVNTRYTEQRLEVAQPLFTLGYKEPAPKPERSLKEKVCTEMLLEVLAGDASPLFERLINAGLVNDEFDAEYFCGHGYAAVLFSGESDDPERVAVEIAKEVLLLKKTGIDQKLFASVRRGMYGDAIRRFNSVELIASQMAECAMSGTGLFDELKYLKTVTMDDVFKRLELLDNAKTTLSVILPKKSDQEEKS